MQTVKPRARQHSTADGPVWIVRGKYSTVAHADLSIALRNWFNEFLFAQTFKRSVLRETTN